MFTNDYEVPDNQSFAFFRAHVTPVLGLPFPSFGTLLPLAALGIGLAWRRRSAQPLILFAASYTVSVLLFYNFSRYRMPVVPMLAVFAAAGIVGLQAGWRRWGGPRFALVVLALALTDAYPERARGFALLAECQRRRGREDAARAAARRFEERSASPD